MQFTDNGKFSVHLKEIHAPTCTACEKTFDSKTDLDKHIEEDHSKESNIICVVCSKSYKTNEDCLQHLEVDHSKCQVCVHTALDEEHLEIHMNENHIFKCLVCDEKLQSEPALKDHTVSAHTIHCPVCAVSFVGKEEFVKHYKYEHHLVCTTCGEVFRCVCISSTGHVSQSVSQ